ncbi:MAG: phosphoribosylformylglycinamidine synthase [Lentimicrobiaceae bacterium]|nr:phosphoribosylformylglycinamidine synthase [Lentimicrobiaceae bacterium]MCB9023901.1 phosphoribosylformylglycinamidine synthase [Lentimicrobiaceae bacterium]MCO5266190.1 phosphoribosylformylglycinamidine synthase [Lentimicrobium sp.]
MIRFFKGKCFYAVNSQHELSGNDIQKLSWLFGGAECLEARSVSGFFIGPRREMITPWSTNAVEITQNMGISGIERIEEYTEVPDSNAAFDPMLQVMNIGLDQQLFTIVHNPEPVKQIDDIAAYNLQEGLALSDDEVVYLNELSAKLGRLLTDSEVFGFSQVNSEHCRHKIFNGTFIIDGKEQDETLFSMIRKTSNLHHNRIVSAYKDNVAFIEGPQIMQFAPATQDKPDFFAVKPVDSVISIKAETHNFPTTVEPFNGAATGSGGEIRDRMAGGKGSMPIAGTAVYMTSYPRTCETHRWESAVQPRKWLYHNPEELLIKASNGASDFGNKFGQPLICGSLLTFEHQTNDRIYGYDKVIMMAGGIGYGRKSDSLKEDPKPGEKVVVLGGDNYRIGMGGGAVSSVATGQFANHIELNAVQRSNPEMQKRVYNAIRAMAEMENNPVVSIHDHGAGGHLNSLSELVEVTGGRIDIDKLPVGDPTLSDREIIGNESQERMGLIIKADDVEMLQRVAARERAPMFVAGETTNDQRLTFINNKTGQKPIDLQLLDMFGKPPRTIMEDSTVKETFAPLNYKIQQLRTYVEKVLQIESVACKDWLTNKVDRSVTGRVAMQQTAGPVQLPLNDLGVVALDYSGSRGIATSIGHAPAAGLIDAKAGSVLSIAEALTNIVWAPLEGGLKGVSLSANWMWPCRNPGEDARLFEAVKAASDFAIALGINIPTGKDSLSMTQKYPDGEKVFSPGTVIISAAAEVIDIKKVISPVIQPEFTSTLLYIDFSADKFKTGGSSLAQILNGLGDEAPVVNNPDYFVRAFEAVQTLINKGVVLAGHDISSGGLVTTLLEMLFAQPGIGLEADLNGFGESDIVKLLFSENPGVVIQVNDLDYTTVLLHESGLKYQILGKPSFRRFLTLRYHDGNTELDIDHMRKLWFRSSYLLDRKQSGDDLAKARYHNFALQPLSYKFGDDFTGEAKQFAINLKRTQPTGIKAAIIREKGVNGDREMAWSLYMAGFDVKDVHMTDLITGRETLEDINMIVFVGGFSNSDVLGSAKGWAGAFLYNTPAKMALDNFFARPDTLSLGVCNGCQLMVELGLIYPGHDAQPKMLHNESGKFESAFLNVDILENNSVMLRNMAGKRLGIWVAHGEGKFSLPMAEEHYLIPMKYSYEAYPGNPNGSDYNAAAIVSQNGRHLAMMPHLERSIYPWNWAYYPGARAADEVSPWVEAFVNARKWINKMA